MFKVDFLKLLKSVDIIIRKDSSISFVLILRFKIRISVELLFKNYRGGSVKRELCYFEDKEINIYKR